MSGEPRDKDAGRPKGGPGRAQGMAANATAIERLALSACAVTLFVVMLVGAADIVSGEVFGVFLPFKVDMSGTLAAAAIFLAWPLVQRCIREGAARLNDRGWFLVYGPFNYGGRYTSESNARFDEWLKSRDPLSGVRDFEAVDELAREAGLVLRKDYEMPANNRTLVWSKLS